MQPTGWLAFARHGRSPRGFGRLSRRTPRCWEGRRHRRWCARVEGERNGM